MTINPVKIAGDLFWWHVGNVVVAVYETAMFLSELDLKIVELEERIKRESQRRSSTDPGS